MAQGDVWAQPIVAGPGWWENNVAEGVYTVTFELTEVSVYSLSGSFESDLRFATADYDVTLHVDPVDPAPIPALPPFVIGLGALGLLGIARWRLVSMHRRTWRSSPRV